MPEGAKAQLPTLRRQLAQIKKAHQTKLQGVRARLESAKTKLEKVRFLVASDALPKARAVRAADAVTRLEQAEQEALTAWTSKLSDVQAQVQAAQLAVRQAENKKQQTANQQWVKSPLTGQIVDIRVTDVSVGGVTLEVLVNQITPVNERKHTSFAATP